MNHESEFRIHSPNAHHVKWFQCVHPDCGNATQGQGPRVKEQDPCMQGSCMPEPWIQEPRTNIPHMCMHAPCKSQIYIPIHAEPGTKSHARSKSQGTRAKQGPRDQPSLPNWGLSTDFLNQILITQKMHAPNIFFAKSPQFGRLHACLTSLKNIPIVYTDLCNAWIGSSSRLHGNTMKPNVQPVGYIYIYICIYINMFSI